MEKSITFLLFICFISVRLFAQDIVVEQSLEWQIPGTYSVKNKGKLIETGKYLSFKEASYFDDKNLPRFSHLLPLEGKKEAKVKIDISESSELKHQEILSKRDKEAISQNVKVNSGVVSSRGETFIQSSFIPLFKKDGRIYKVESFQLKYYLTEKTKRSETPEFADNSIFRDGRWLKIGIRESGVYKLTYNQLKSQGFSDLSNIGIFGNGEGVLPLENSAYEDKDPSQVSVYCHFGGDGEFNEGDYILFYGASSNQWKYHPDKDFFFYEMHPYSEKNYYYITNSATIAKEIKMLDIPEESATRKVESFLDYKHYEKNQFNLVQSGREWYGERFGVQNSYDFDFQFPDRLENKPVSIATRMVSRSSQNSSFDVSVNEEELTEIFPGTVSFNYTGQYARASELLGKKVVNGDKINIRIKYKPLNSKSLGWLDYITVNAVRELRMQGNQMHFRYKGDSPYEVVEFVISNAEQNLTIWDVTDPVHVKKIRGVEIKDGKATFKTYADTTYREFIVFSDEEFLNPETEGQVANQNLHGIGALDMLIVTKENFISQAGELADLHESHDGLKTKVVTDKEIFNEFSSGCPDPAAVRNFVRFIYENSNSSDSLKYLLLFGDGAYDNRECHNNGNLLTYQSEESLHYSNSFVSDDFFGMLDETDNIEARFSGLVDIGIGRLPVNTVEEAQNAVNKIQKYIDHKPEEAWMNKLVFVADDEDNNDHVEDAELLSSFVSENFGQFDIDKIYMDAFDQQTSATGSSYPAVNEKINEKVNNGVLLVNYSGHGGERYLAHERILTKEDIASWKNDEKMPVFMTATCEFTRFDHPSYTSAGEEIFLKETGGAIALFSTTRLVYANQNYALNRAFYDFVFKNPVGNKSYRLGDIVRLTKNNAGNDDNKRNFSLFGDPALKLPVGNFGVQTDSIVKNGQTSTDTIKALDKVTVYGHIILPGGTPETDFNGTLFMRVKDKKKVFYTKANDGGSTFAYQLRNSSLFAGQASVEDGRFQVEFIVPKNAEPTYGKGKILYWAQDGEAIAQGSYEQLLVGGVSNIELNDWQGPDIQLYMNDRNFRDGVITNENPLLLADLEDESGVNIAGDGISHDIIATIDGKSDEKIVLNEYYQAKENTYKEGSVKYQLNNLESGKHTLKLEAWDIANNYSSASIEFTVKESSEFKLSKLYNYPNPFSENTSFYFEHNRPGEMMHITMEIFDLSGYLLNKAEKKLQPSGFRTGPVSFEGINNLGNKYGAGVYIYRMSIRMNDGEKAQKSQKMIIVK